VAQLYSQALGSLFIAFYDSQRYGVGIRTGLHMGLEAGALYIASARTAQKTRLPTALLLFRAYLLRPSCDGYLATAEQRTYMQSRSLATAVSAGFQQTCHNTCVQIKQQLSTQMLKVPLSFQLYKS
jgi:hypothetical protein